MYGSRRAERPNQAMAVESGWGPGADFSGRWPWPHNTNGSRNWVSQRSRRRCYYRGFVRRSREFNMGWRDRGLLSAEIQQLSIFCCFKARLSFTRAAF